MAEYRRILLDGNPTHMQLIDGELVVVIGRIAKQVRADDWADYVFGYTCGNDVSARDQMFADGQWARAKGFDASTKATTILAWLAEDYGLGRGHGMALVHVITKGDRIASTHVGTGTAHSDPNDHLWLDGVATKPEDY